MDSTDHCADVFLIFLKNMKEKVIFYDDNFFEDVIFVFWG